MVLHTVNQSPFDRQTLAQCLARCHPEKDAIVLLEDGVYAALKTHPWARQLEGVTCYAIAEDLLARGLQPQQQLAHIQPIDFDRFVELTIDYPLTQSWY